MILLRKSRDFALGVIFATLVCVLVVNVHAALAERRIDVLTGVTVFVDGVRFAPTDANGNPVEIFTYNGNTYVPSEEIARAWGKGVNWNAETLTLHLGSANPSHHAQGPIRTFLESDIHATDTSGNWRGHPSRGSFTMDGVTYHRGVSVSDTHARTVRGTFDIVGQGFTRLYGVFGIIHLQPGGASRSGSLTVLCAESGRFLGGADVYSRGLTTQEVNIFIPPDVRRVAVTLQQQSGMRVGFGDAFFE